MIKHHVTHQHDLVKICLAVQLMKLHGKREHDIEQMIEHHITNQHLSG